MAAGRINGRHWVAVDGCARGCRRHVAALLAVSISAAKQEVNVMKSHATAATLVGAALLSAAAAVSQTPTTPGRAMKGTLIETTVASTNVPAPAPRHGEANAVPISYYLPKNYDANRADRYPLPIQLPARGTPNKHLKNSP